MAKRLMAKIEEYQKDGQTKGKYVEIGVILSNENGEFALINPSVSLSGVIMLQRLLAAATGKKAGDRVMCAIFDNDQQQQPQQQPQAPDLDPDVPF